MCPFQKDFLFGDPHQVVRLHKLHKGRVTVYQPNLSDRFLIISAYLELIKMVKKKKLSNHFFQKSLLMFESNTACTVNTKIIVLPQEKIHEHMSHMVNDAFCQKYNAHLCHNQTSARLLSTHLNLPLCSPQLFCCHVFCPYLSHNIHF